MKTIASIAFCTSLMLAGSPAMADTSTSTAATPAEDMDCSVLLTQDYSVIPVVIGYIISANSITEIDQLEPVEIDDIVEACQKQPQSKVSKVAAQEVKD